MTHMIIRSEEDSPAEENVAHRNATGHSAETKRFRFVCPECGGHELVHERTSPSEAALIEGLEYSNGAFKLHYERDPDGTIAWEWDEFAESRHSFRCEGCYTDIDCHDDESLVEWLRAHCSEEEGDDDDDDGTEDEEKAGDGPDDSMAKPPVSR